MMATLSLIPARSDKTSIEFTSPDDDCSSNTEKDEQLFLDFWQHSSDDLSPE
ncbi:hypothetical protein F2Q68_00017541 [Brassica cretica]|uniref:Uncharacterized protein n=2 Tax=Brassica cretica TaxID=69181 RepID=A0A8S9HQS8_BRACR|nr:hypothetical protein F2Q68_00017541 [Brassica cretica]KAF3605897.1 hypothetical protein DY000_02050353 [Brassica cretica]